MANLLASWSRYNDQETRTLTMGSTAVSKAATSNGEAITSLGGPFAKGSAVKIVRAGSSGAYTYTVTDCTDFVDADYIVASDFAAGGLQLYAYIVKDSDADNVIAK